VNSEQRKTLALSEVNRGILLVAHDSIDEHQEWDFFCECGQENCHTYVAHTLDAYTSLHDSGRPVLAEGHHVNQAERARQLHADAEALTRQAEHQLRRAQWNLRDRSSPPEPGAVG
jgi:hypothetical protein